MKKLTIWCLILAMMLALFAGCGQEPAPAEEPASAPAASGEAPAPAPEPEPEPEPEPTAPVEESLVEEPVEEVPQFVPVELPIVTEPTIFSIWYTWPPVLTNFVEGPGATPFAQELEKRTGVHIDYVIANTEAANEEFSLMVASGSYTDMILGATAYYNNPDQLIEDGVAVNVADYLDLMPNLEAVLASNKEYKLAAYTDSGDIETYMEETVTSVLVGNTPVSALEDMAGNLTAMKIDEAIALMQAAYDRYMSKAA